MSPIDLREYKAELRAKRRRRREALSDEHKKELDRRIAERVTSLYQYKNAKTVMIYVSTAIEVDTFEIIERALADGKKIALPRCIKGTRNMEFHYISSLDDLERGSFNVLEPKEELEIVTDYSDTLMVVPALSLDSFGYRLGYGGGYYDRFLSDFKGKSVGVYRTGFLHGEDLPRESTDKKCSHLASREGVRRLKGE